MIYDPDSEFDCIDADPQYIEGWCPNPACGEHIWGNDLIHDKDGKIIGCIFCNGEEL